MLSVGDQYMAFKPGQSGNRSGRPKGLKDRRNLFRDMVAPSCPQLVHKAIEMALEGNEQMIKLLLDRILPAKPKDDPIDINLESDSLVTKTKSIFKALSDGKISPSATATLIQSVAIEAKIYETEKLKYDLAKLEKIVYDQNWSNN
jgi:hypothetical protein